MSTRDIKYEPLTPDEIRMYDAHALWAESLGAEGTRAVVLSDESHPFADFRGRRLSSAYFFEVDFHGACFDHANLDVVWAAGINFTDASMVETRLMKANLTHANLTGVYAPRASFLKAELNRAILDKGHFQSVDFYHCWGIGTSFQGADLQRTNFTHAIVTSVNFTGANLTGAIFTRALFDEATTFKDTVGLDHIVAEVINLNGTHIHDPAEIREFFRSRQ